MNINRKQPIITYFVTLSIPNLRTAESQSDRNCLYGLQGINYKYLRFQNDL